MNTYKTHINTYNFIRIVPFLYPPWRGKHRVYKVVIHVLYVLYDLLLFYIDLNRLVARNLSELIMVRALG